MSARSPNSTSIRLLVDAEGVIALDARIVVHHPQKGQERAARFAIRPYPVELETEIEHRGEKLRIRPIRPDDEPMLQAFTRRMTPEDVRMRFFGPMRELSHELAARPDADRLRPRDGLRAARRQDMIGVGRLVADPDFQQAEFALTVASDRQGRGYGELLLRHVLLYGKSRGVKRVIGHVLRENRKMLDLAKQIGFRRESGRSGEPDIRVVKSLAGL